MTRSGLVLAGGASLRFGARKPFALFDGQPMVRRMCDVLRPLCDEVLVSAAAEDVAGLEAAVPGVRVVADGARNRGPIEGFRRGFGAARGELVLVAPSDAPLLRPELYGGLLAILGDHDAAVPRHEAVDPVRAVYRRSVAIRVLAREDVRSPSALVDRLDAVLLEGDALRAADPCLDSFIDVNRREDLDQAIRAAALRA